jgi:hypothetical protein
MTTVGLVMMILSNGLVLALTGYCFYRVCRAPEAEKHEHGMLDIDTRDTDSFH